MDYKLEDLIDIPKFQDLQDRLNEIYSFPSAIIDNDGNILTATAWQEVCTQFHRKNKECEKFCIESDKYILSHLDEANPAVSYKCPHGLVDNATPIIVNGIHYGNFFTGQFFLEEPDLEFFKTQAKIYGFDEKAYIEAINKVPVWSQKQLDNYLIFIKGLIEIISETGLRNLREIEIRKKIEESEYRSNSILSQMSDGFWITDIKGKIIEVNDALCRMVGYSRDELLSMTIADIDNDESLSMIKEKIKKIIETGATQFESSWKKKNGTHFYVETKVSYLSKTKLVYGFHHDISERKRNELIIQNDQKELKLLLAETNRSRNALLSVVEDHVKAKAEINQINSELEERVRERTEQLEASNKELEAFSYSVSHDLRTPLRGIDGWSQALKEDYEDKLDDKGRLFIDRIRGETVRMGNLIEGLLNLSRISRLECKLEPVDLSALAQEIWNRSEEECQVNQCKFINQPGLIATADRTLINIVLTNLISNAIKFSSKNPHPLIEFGQTMVDEHLTYFVRDNGAGFDMTFAKNLFGTFQRMHKQSEFPGTGVGLSTVQRIITRHGGKVWAEAKVNQGATFYFTLMENRKN